MVNRNKKLAFIQVTGDGGTLVYERMTGFTEFTVNLNPKEYSRKYIDEASERSEVVAYQPTISYKFDMEEGNKTQEAFIYAAEHECLGDEALVKIAIVDMSAADQSEYQASIREYVIIPDSEGDDTDVYTFSGTMKAAGTKTYETVTSSDNWQTLKIS